MTLECDRRKEIVGKAIAKNGACLAPRKGAAAEQRWLTEFELLHGGAP